MEEKIIYPEKNLIIRSLLIYLAVFFLATLIVVLGVSLSHGFKKGIVMLLIVFTTPKFLFFLLGRWDVWVSFIVFILCLLLQYYRYSYVYVLINKEGIGLASKRRRKLIPWSKYQGFRLTFFNGGFYFQKNILRVPNIFDKDLLEKEISAYQYNLKK